jgi:hypothetical protein
MQPTATSVRQVPNCLSRAACTIASIDSCLAASMNPHVLMTMTSARSSCVVCRDQLGEVALAVDCILVAAERDEADVHGVTAVAGPGMDET